MITLFEKLQVIYPGIDPLIDIEIVDNGNGQFINAWRYMQPQPSPAELAAAELPAARNLKIAEIEKSCEAHIGGGFVSSALGSPYTYGSTQQDQTNILGAKVAGIDMLFTCVDANGVKAQRLHTAAQLSQVYIDGMIFLQTAYATLNTKISAVNQAQSVDAVQGIIW